MFLRAVTYKAPEICKPMYSFESVASNPDEIIQCLTVPEEEMSDEQQPQPSSASAPSATRVSTLADVCSICLDRKKQMCFEKCKHLCICEPCFKALVTQTKEKPRPKVTKRNPLMLKCPYCRTLSDVKKCFMVFST